MRVVADATISAYNGPRRHIKRAIDVLGTLLLLLIALPLMGAIALVIRLRSPGPAVFRQERVGRDGRSIRVLKFRTMYVDAAEQLRNDPVLRASYVRNDYKVPAGEDPGIAPCGRFLRRSSLDELPQLFNVLGGSMSLVGPRPIVAGELGCYGELAWAYVGVKPGVTGRWQTHGRNRVRYPERARLDAEYLADWSLHGDFAILVKTIPQVLRRYGTH